MKKVLFTMFALGALVVTSKAQVQIGAQGSYLKGAGDNKDVKIWGGGLHAKFFVGKNFAIGAVATTYPKTSSEFASGAATYKVSNVVTNIAASFDYLLMNTDNMVQPYIGADAGINMGNQIVNYTNTGQGNQAVENRNKESHFLLAPKVGVNIGLGKTFGIFGQGQYNFTFGNSASENLTIGGVQNAFKSAPASKFWTLSAGIYVRLVGANKVN